MDLNSIKVIHYVYLVSQIMEKYLILPKIM